ncbi:DUF167 domain-containing protein [Candidatus Pacearchaeota archaeon]|nr:MAG: DUF167 domain-containing protein [Candidatus Pacearchaeota archaeon]
MKIKIKVKVKPNSREDKLEKISEASYLAWVKAPAREGKANLAVQRLLAKEFKVSPLDVNIKTPSSREKVVEIIAPD